MFGSKHQFQGSRNQLVESNESAHGLPDLGGSNNYLLDIRIFENVSKLTVFPILLSATNDFGNPRIDCRSSKIKF